MTSQTRDALRSGFVLGLVLMAAALVFGQATYPSSVKSFTTKNNGDTLQAAHVNDLQTEVTAIEGGLLNGIGHILKPTPDATYDLGTSSLKWRDLYLSRNATIGGTLDVTGVTTLANTGLHLLDTDASHDLIIKPGSNITADRTLTITTGDANRTLTLSADVTLSATPYAPGGTDVALADGGTAASLADPNADRVMFWDDSAGSVDWLTMGTGLSITGTTLNSTASAAYALTCTGISVSGGDWAPADASVSYFCGFPGRAIGTTAALNQIRVPVAGTVTKATVSIKVEGTLGTTETFTVAMRLNNSTDTTITSSAQANATFQSFSSGTLSTSVAAGDLIEIKVTAPTWATNPTTMSMTAIIYITA